MNGWRLSWLRLKRHPVQTLVLILCIAVPVFLPSGVRVLIADYQSSLTSRAEATPMILGARGNRFDLTFAALYFRKGKLETIPFPELQKLQDERGLAVPIHCRFSAQGYPVVGTTPEYFEQRRARMLRGDLPLQLGEAVLGADVAAELNLTVGDKLFSDQAELYDIAVPPALKMNVVGVLAPANTADDGAVFVGIETSWILEGLAHGHVDAESEEMDPDLVLGGNEENVVLSEALIEYNEITAENMGSFHYHGDPSLLPLTAILFWPEDDKAGTLVKARINNQAALRMLTPRTVMDDLLAFVLKVRSLVDAVSWMLGGVTALLTLLVFLLSSRLRAREVLTLERLGCSRFFVAGLYLSELAIVLISAIALAAIGVWSGRQVFADLLFQWIS